MGHSRSRTWPTRVWSVGGTAGTTRGLVHRIFQKYLAVKHLARLSLDPVRNYCVEAGRKAPWHEVTLTLMQLLERQDDVDGLIEEIRKPVSDCLDEPPTNPAHSSSGSQINCSRSKARELMTQVFSWIECGRWMPLRLSLVREVAAGLESEHVGALVASRIGHGFPAGSGGCMTFLPLR